MGVIDRRRLDRLGKRGREEEGKMHDPHIGIWTPDKLLDTSDVKVDGRLPSTWHTEELHSLDT
ncbi:hypothetical protein EAF00_008839 [Botryotinia globosa]|nr:hypothetical protein EAF00_008839 [Botryotinia globosa]